MIEIATSFGDALYLIPISLLLSYFALMSCVHFRRKNSSSRPIDGGTVERGNDPVTLQQIRQTSRQSLVGNGPAGHDMSNGHLRSSRQDEVSSEPTYEEPREVVRNSRGQIQHYEEINVLQQTSSNSDDRMSSPAEYNKISVREPLSRVLEERAALEHTYNEVDDEGMSSFYEEIAGSATSSVTYARIGPRTVGVSADLGLSVNQNSDSTGSTPTPPPPPPPPPSTSVVNQLKAELIEVRKALDQERQIRMSLEDQIKTLEAQLYRERTRSSQSSHDNSRNFDRDSSPDVAGYESIKNVSSENSPAIHDNYNQESLQPTTIFIKGLDGQLYTNNSIRLRPPPVRMRDSRHEERDHVIVNEIPQELEGNNLCGEESLGAVGGTPLSKSVVTIKREGPPSSRRQVIKSTSLPTTNSSSSSDSRPGVIV